MRAARFEYFQPKDIREAQLLLVDNPGSWILAGGQWLVPSLALREIKAHALVDLVSVRSLRGFTYSGETVRIGPMTTLTELTSGPSLRKRIPALTEMASRVGALAMRNRATVGGNLAQPTMAQPLTCLLAALGATVRLAGAGVFADVTAYRTMPPPRPLIDAVNVPVETSRRFTVIGLSPTVLGAPPVWAVLTAGYEGEVGVLLSGLTPQPLTVTDDLDHLPAWVRQKLPGLRLNARGWTPER